MVVYGGRPRDMFVQRKGFSRHQIGSYRRRLERSILPPILHVVVHAAVRRTAVFSSLGRRAFWLLRVLASRSGTHRMNFVFVLVLKVLAEQRLRIEMRFASG